MHLNDILHIPATSNEAFIGTINATGSWETGTGIEDPFNYGPYGLDPVLPHVADWMTLADDLAYQADMGRSSALRGRPLPPSPREGVADVAILNIPPTVPILSAHHGTNGSAVHHDADHRRVVYEVLTRVMQQLPLT